MLCLRINNALTRKGMTQAELARECKVSEVTMSRWCSGTRIPNATNLRRLAISLGVTADWLLEIDHRDPRPVIKIELDEEKVKKIFLVLCKRNKVN